MFRILSSSDIPLRDFRWRWGSCCQWESRGFGGPGNVLYGMFDCSMGEVGTGDRPFPLRSVFSSFLGISVL